MIREALVFHYMDDMDSKLAAVRVAFASDSGDSEWSAYSGALGRKFLRLDAFLKAQPDNAASGELKADGAKPVDGNRVEVKKDEPKREASKSDIAKIGDLFVKS
jgi:hypothetical protein